MASTTARDSAPAPAAARAAQLLDLLAREAGPVTITRAAGELGLAKSSVSNLLRSLESEGMVRRHGTGWLLGYKLLELSRSMLGSTPLVAEFRRRVAGLGALREETVLLAVLDGTDVLYVDRHDGQQPVRFINQIGTRMPAVVSGLGRAMLAGLHTDDLDERLARVETLPRPTPHSHRTHAALRDDLDAIRERGHAVDAEQGVPGVACFGVAVPSASTPTAVSATFLASRRTPELERALVTELHALATHLQTAEAPARRETP